MRSRRFPFSSVLTATAFSFAWAAMAPALAQEWKINFQPAHVETPPGYIRDTGESFGERPSGNSFGWSNDNTAQTRDRGKHKDPRHDTLNHFQKSEALQWELALPNGHYAVYVAMGDPMFKNQSNALVIEDRLFEDPDGGDAFDDHEGIVEVQDGRLTLAPGPNAQNAKIQFIHITTAPAPVPPAPTASAQTAQVTAQAHDGPPVAVQAALHPATPPALPTDPTATTLPVLRAEILGDPQNDPAFLMAGLPVSSGSPLESHMSEPWWIAHQNELSRVWNEYERSTVAPAVAWAEAEWGRGKSRCRTVFYPFSGPDILHALVFFPEADLFIMGGLEPVGQRFNLAELDSAQMAAGAAQLRDTLHTIIRISFFITKEMKSDLAGVFDGVTPVIQVFLARMGKRVIDIETLRLHTDGALRALGPAESPNAVRIRFSGQEPGREKTLIYLSMDISNPGLKNNGFQTYVASHGPVCGYLKAASYLLHYDSFSSVRDQLLNQSILLLQDDSGVPWRHLDPNRWNIRLYGSYVAPIDLFKERYQADLRQAYDRSAQPLPFGTGYRYRRGESNLILAVRR